MPPVSTSPQGFMPHEAPVVSSAARQKGQGMKELFLLISIVLFIASAALAAGVFLYEQYLTTSSASKIDQLARAEAAFEPALIRELTRLDDRMRSANEILGDHIAPTAFFSMLEQSTIATVAFSSLTFSAKEPGTMTIEMQGVAASVNAIALQADVFAKGGMVTSPIFSDIDRQADGIHFSLSAFIDPEAVNFAQLVSRVQAMPAQEVVSEPTIFGNPAAPEEVGGEAPTQ